uniref:Uncharacterized protein n=1 Tax=Oryza barthii TaxID=65489 RepID=A0A0D3GPR3_9ORYZ
MASESKLDLLLRTMEENERKREVAEKKREEAKERARKDFLDLKKVFEVRIPLVEKKVEELGASVQTLSDKVTHIEGTIFKQENPQEPTGQESSWLAVPVRGLSEACQEAEDLSPVGNTNRE